jgi:CIC family chloride channel protein
VADLISRGLFGSAPFLTGVPHNLSLHGVLPYLLIAVLGVLCAAIGWSFKTVLYGMEDGVDRLWRGRPEWARPAVGGLALGALLLLLPQMYGVGYPVMDKILSGQYVLGFVLLLLVGKVLATSLTLSIGGSGGIFAPSLFVGAAAGAGFGSIVHHLFGAAAGPSVIYGVVGMGGLFAGATQSPLTAMASVAEMSGNFTLTIPILLITGIAAAVSRQFSYANIYTEKLLRRGVDIESEAGGGSGAASLAAADGDPAPLAVVDADPASRAVPAAGSALRPAEGFPPQDPAVEHPEPVT